MNENEQLAMIERVGVGAYDRGVASFWFTVTADGVGALMIWDVDDPMAKEIIASVNEVHDLNGRVCVVENLSPGGIARFARLLPAAQGYR